MRAPPVAAGGGGASGGHPLDAVLEDAFGASLEALLRRHMPVGDGLSETVNERVAVYRDSHHYLGDPEGEEALTCLGRVVVDGRSYRFAWTALYRDDAVVHSTVYVRRSDFPPRK